jgi:hypothetical protein
MGVCTTCPALRKASECAVFSEDCSKPARARSCRAASRRSPLKYFTVS